MFNSGFAFHMWAQAQNTRGFSLPIKLSFVLFKFFHDIIELKQKLNKSQKQTERILWFPGQPFAQHEHRLQQLCITEPLNRLSWSTETFRDHLIQSSCPGQGHLSLHQPQPCLAESSNSHRTDVSQGVQAPLPRVSVFSWKSSLVSHLYIPSYGF